MIIGNHVILRHLKEEDRKAYHEWINDRELVHCNSTYHPISDTNHNEWFDGITKKKSLVIFSIVEKENNSLIGSCSLRNIDYLHRNAELQIRICAQKYWGKGLGEESVRLLLCHAFDDLNLERVYLHVFADNIRAFKTYKKCGFQEEGILRMAAYINGAYVDIKIMSILRQDFQKAK